MATASQVVKIKIEDVCRTCLSKENELHSVFDISIGTVTLDCVIAEITGIKIDNSDGLPSTICLGCKEKASKAYDFKKQSQDANATLQSVFKKEKNEFLQENENSQIQSSGANIKTENPAGEDNDYVDWMGLDDINDIEAVKDEHDMTTEKTVIYQCKNCNEVFKTHSKLQEHMTKKCLKVEFEDAGSNYCPLCGTSYYDAVNLTTHMWEAHADLMGPKKRGRPKKILTTTILTKLSENGFRLKAITVDKYDCMLCKEPCKTKEELGIHLVKHKDTKVFCCLICKKMYLKNKNFNRHTCTDDKANVKKELDSLETPDKSKQSLASEMALEDLLEANGFTENGSPLQVCEICSGVFTSEAELMTHNDMEHPERSLRCNLCLKVFASVKSAARHRSICKQIERKHKCSTCGLKFAYEISLNKHILRYHEGQSVSVKFMDSKCNEEKQYQCDTCSKQFSRKELLAKHTRTHSDKLYECDICKKKFNRSDNLRSHKRTHDPREKTKANTCLCLYCGRSFNNSSNLIVHMRRHTGEKPYKCDFCGKGFPRSSDLQCHRRSHTGEKPCVCRICGKGFSRSNKLSRHMRVHTGLKPYKCTYCEKAFSQSNDLTLHIRRHTGDKPYICEVCGDRFIQGTALHNHRRTHGHFPPTATDAQSQPHSITYPVQNITHQSSDQ